MSGLQQQFGQIDIYLFYQLLRGRIAPGMRILDAGCGHGRNLVYLLREGYEVFGTDADPAAIAAVHTLVARLAPHLPLENFRAEPLEHMTFPDAFVDVVLSSAVLHFARDEDHFTAMLHGSWRILRPGGVFFCRLASSIGMENRVRRLDGRRHQLPDGSERFLVDEPFLMQRTRELGGTLLDACTIRPSEQRALPAAGEYNAMVCGEPARITLQNAQAGMLLRLDHPARCETLSHNQIVVAFDS